MRRFKTLAALAALVTLLSACALKPQTERPADPPEGYRRHLVVMLEKDGTYRPLAGALVKIDLKSPGRLVSPSGGTVRANGQGQFNLIIEPQVGIDQTAAKDGDMVADYLVEAELAITFGGRTATAVIKDTQTYARYRDGTYQGLNRDPEQAAEYFSILVP